MILVRTRIRELRARDRLTQMDLARKVGCRRETISFVENGQHNLSLLLALRIARVFKCRVDEVFHYDEDELEVT